VDPATTGNLHLCVTTQNCYPNETDIPVSGSVNQPVLTYAGCRIVAQDSSGQLEPGAVADLYVSLTNSGTKAATGVTAILRPFSPLITLLDSVSDFGTIAAGATVEGSKFRIRASASMSPGARLEFTLHCTATPDTWNPYFSFNVGNARPARKLWSDHDIGNMILSVTSVGSIGTLGPYYDGSGLKYPRTAGFGSLYFSSLACSNGPSYVVDRWYAHPSSTYNTDWKVVDTLDSIVPPVAAQQEYRAVFNDSGHPTPKGLTVTQWSGSLSKPGYQDFVVLNYTLQNKGTQAINGLYAGVMSDFAVNNDRTNDLGTDNTRRMAWVTDSSTAWVGVKLLNPTTAANVSGLENSRYITPSNMMTEAVKDSFLRGAINLASGHNDSFSCVVSAGPFNLAPGARQEVAFAFVGGLSQDLLMQNADSAQSWFDRQIPMGVTYLRSIVNDTPPGGNGDGVINPGESINLPVWVTNASARPSQGVWAVLRKTSNDTLVTITDSLRYIGALEPGDSGFTGANGFRFRVASACTNDYALPLTLVCRDTLNTTLSSNPGLRVSAPQLVTNGVMCWDPPPGGNGNGRLDPNEQAQIALGLDNIGPDGVQNVAARLKSGDSLLTIVDTLGTWGAVLSDSTVFDTTVRFTVRVGNVPRETPIPCTLFISGSHYAAVRAMTLNAGRLAATDPLPDGPRIPPLYYAYDDVDSAYNEHPTFNWIETRGHGTRLSLDDDQTVTLPLPAGFGSFRYYGQDYTSLSVSSNGFIIPGSSTTSLYENAALPSTTLGGPAICPCWTDLCPGDGNGVWWFPDTADHALVVEWDSVAYYSPRTSWDKFEVVFCDSTLRDSSDNNPFAFQYLTANNYTGNTVGIQNPSQTIGINALFDGSYAHACAQIVPHRAMYFTTGSPETGAADAGWRRPGPRLTLLGMPSLLRNNNAHLRLNLPVSGRVRLAVHDVTGRRIRTLIDADLKPGLYTVSWNRTDDLGRKVAAGIYLYRLETPAGALNLKAVVLN
jgi:hypothetical protein